MVSVAWVRMDGAVCVCKAEIVEVGRKGIVRGIIGVQLVGAPVRELMGCI